MSLAGARPGSRLECPCCGKTLQLGRKKKAPAKGAAAALAKPASRPRKPAPTDTLIKEVEPAHRPFFSPETAPAVEALSVPPEALIESGDFPVMPAAEDDEVSMDMGPAQPAPPPAGDDLAVLGQGPVDLSKLERLQTVMDTARNAEGLRSPLSAYELVRELGRGGMATVYEARQRSLDRPVALKIMAERFSDNADLVRRFEQEAKALAGMNHPNIIGVFDRGHEANLLYFAMEYIEGPSLDIELRGLPENRMDTARAIKIITQVAAALAYTHKNGTIHRDIKPGNILLAPGDRVKVTDFGLAHVFRGDPGAGARTIVGTPKYMAPEQVLGEAVDHRADIFAMGLVFHEMLTGELPGQSGRTLREILPDLPEHVPWLIGRCLESDRTRRFQSAFHVQETLAEMAAGGEGATASAIQDAVTTMMEPTSPSQSAPPEPVAAAVLRQLETQSTVAPTRPEVSRSSGTDSGLRGPPIGPPPEVLEASDLDPAPKGPGPGPSPEVDISDILRKAREKKKAKTESQGGPSPFGKPVPKD